MADVVQIVKSGPAEEMVGKSSLTTATVAIEGGQTPLEMVHWKIFTPTPNPVIPVEGESGDVMVPEPAIRDH